RLLGPSDADSVPDRCGSPASGEPTPDRAADVCAVYAPAALAGNTTFCAWLLLALCRSENESAGSGVGALPAAPRVQPDSCPADPIGADYPQPCTPGRSI